MNKGGLEKAPMAKPVEGKKDTSKPKGGEVKFGYAPAGRTGKKAQCFNREDRAWIKNQNTFHVLSVSLIVQQ